MRETVKFPLFGKDADYLCFTVENILQAELSLEKSIQKIYEALINNDCGIAMSCKLLAIALQESYPGITTDVVLKKMFEAFDNGHTISNVVIPLAHAIAVSGPFGSGKKQNKEKEAGPEKSAEASESGSKPWNRSRTGL